MTRQYFFVIKNQNKTMTPCLLNHDDDNIIGKILLLKKNREHKKKIAFYFSQTVFF